MFREYAVDPDVCSNPELFLLILESFRQSKGRFLTRAPRNWMLRAKEALERDWYGT